MADFLFSSKIVVVLLTRVYLVIAADVSLAIWSRGHSSKIINVVEVRTVKRLATEMTSRVDNCDSECPV